MVEIIDGTYIIWDYYNIPHISLINIYNSYCWMITGMQRLSSSPTLKKLLMTFTKKELSEKKFNELVYPIRILNELTKSNYAQITEELREYFKNNDKYKECNGFSSIIYISKYILPYIYYLVNNSNNILKKILLEIGLSSSSLNNGLSSVKILPIFNEQLEEEFIKNYYNSYIQNFIEGFVMKGNHVIPDKVYTTEIECWSKDNMGHVVPVILGKDNNYYVFDDTRQICNLYNFLSLDYNFDKLKFNTTNEQFKQLLRNLIQKKLNDKFEIVESLVYMTITKKKNTNNTLSGGNRINNYNKQIILIIVLSTILMIIIIVIIVIFIEMKSNLNGINKSVKMKSNLNGINKSVKMKSNLNNITEKYKFFIK